MSSATRLGCCCSSRLSASKTSVGDAATIGEVKGTTGKLALVDVPASARAAKALVAALSAARTGCLVACFLHGPQTSSPFSHDDMTESPSLNVPAKSAVRHFQFNHLPLPSPFACSAFVLSSCPRQSLPPTLHGPRLDASIPSGAWFAAFFLGGMVFSRRRRNRSFSLCSFVTLKSCSIFVERRRERGTSERCALDQTTKLSSVPTYSSHQSVTPRSEIRVPRTVFMTVLEFLGGVPAQTRRIKSHQVKSTTPASSTTGT